MSTFITIINMSRALTVEETALRDAEIARCVAVGTTNGSVAGTGTGTNVGGAGIRIWSTIDAANSYVAWAQSNFDPAPDSASALTI